MHILFHIRKKRESISQKCEFFENVDLTVSKHLAEITLTMMEDWTEEQLNQPSTKQALKEFEMTNEAYTVSEELREMLFVLLQDIQSMLKQILSADHGLFRSQVTVFEMAVRDVAACLEGFDKWSIWNEFYAEHLKFITEFLEITHINRLIPSDDTHSEDGTES